MAEQGKGRGGAKGKEKKRKGSKGCRVGRSCYINNDKAMVHCYSNLEGFA